MKPTGRQLDAGKLTDPRETIRNRNLGHRGTVEFRRRGQPKSRKSDGAALDETGTSQAVNSNDRRMHGIADTNRKWQRHRRRDDPSAEVTGTFFGARANVVCHDPAL